MSNIAKVGSHTIASSRSLAANPHPAAALSRPLEEGFDADFEAVGKDVWKDYPELDEGVIVKGEALTFVKRVTSDGEVRYLLVLRATTETKCKRTHKEGDEVRGKLSVETVDGMKVKVDRYTVPAGTIIATNLRRIFTPLLPFIKTAEAHEVAFKVLGKAQVRANPKFSYWDMRFAKKPLGYARDTSLDEPTDAEISGQLE